MNRLLRLRGEKKTASESEPRKAWEREKGATEPIDIPIARSFLFTPSPPEPVHSLYCLQRRNVVLHKFYIKELPNLTIIILPNLSDAQNNLKIERNMKTIVN